MEHQEYPTKRLATKDQTVLPLATLATTTIELYKYRIRKINTAQAVDALAADVKHWVVSTPIVNIPDLQRIHYHEEELSNQWKVTAVVLTYEGSIYVPKDDLLGNKAIRLFHDNQHSGNFGALESTVLVSRDSNGPQGTPWYANTLPDANYDTKPRHHGTLITAPLCH
jgi:hypothetical protein